MSHVNVLDAACALLYINATAFIHIWYDQSLLCILVSYAAASFIHVCSNVIIHIGYDGIVIMEQMSLHVFTV
jgi:hypothetical protein